MDVRANVSEYPIPAVGLGANKEYCTFGNQHLDPTSHPIRGEMEQMVTSSRRGPGYGCMDFPTARWDYKAIGW